MTETDRAIPRFRLRAHALPLAALVLIPLLLAAYDFARHGRSVRMVDEYFYHAHARSWYFDRDCDYDNDILMAPGFKLAPLYAKTRTATGLLFNHFPTGTAVVSYAGLAIGDSVTITHNAIADPDLPRDGYSHYYQMTVGFVHTMLGIVGLLAGYTLARRYFTPTIAATAMLAILLGTNALYYIAIESTHSHADSIAWVMILALLTDTVRRDGFDPLRGLLMGLITGLMVATRSQDAVWALVPIITLTVPWLRDLGRTDLRIRAAVFAALAVAGTILAYTPQLWVNRQLHGQWLFNAYRAVEVHGQPAVLHWSDPDFLRPLLDSSVGLLWTAPLAVLVIPGLIALLRRRTDGHAGAGGGTTLPAVAITAAVMYYVVACVWWNFSGFGHRYLSSLTLAYALALCVVLAWAAQHRRRLVAVTLAITAFVIYELSYMTAVYTGAIPNAAIAPLYAWLVGS